MSSDKSTVKVPSTSPLCLPSNPGASYQAPHACLLLSAILCTSHFHAVCLPHLIRKNPQHLLKQDLPAWGIPHTCEGLPPYQDRGWACAGWCSAHLSLISNKICAIPLAPSTGGISRSHLLQVDTWKRVNGFSKQLVQITGSAHLPK